MAAAKLVKNNAGDRIAVDVDECSAHVHKAVHTRDDADGLNRQPQRLAKNCYDHQSGGGYVGRALVGDEGCYENGQQLRAVQVQPVQLGQKGDGQRLVQGGTVQVKTVAKRDDE